MHREPAVVRPAVRADIASLSQIMQMSLRTLGRQAYDDQQIASALRYIGQPDEQLIDDGTYFVALVGDEIVGCGGWSRRRKVYSGSAAASNDQDRLDPATEPARIRAMFVRPEWARRGIGRKILEHSEQQAAAAGFRTLRLVAMHSAGAIYEAAGYRSIADTPITLEDGIVLACTLMEKRL